MNTRYCGSVNRTSTTNQQMTFKERLARNDQAGRASLGLHLMFKAEMEQELHSGDRRVLVALYILMIERGHAYPKRESLAAMTGLKPKSVSNSLTKLRRLEYISLATGDPEDCSEPTKSFMHGDKASLGELQAQIMKYLDDLPVRSSSDTGNNEREVPRIQGTQLPCRQGSSSPAGNKSSSGTGNFSKQKEGHSLYEDNIYIPPSTESSVGRVEVAATPLGVGGEDFEERTQRLVTDVARWANMPIENARQWVSTQRAYLNGNAEPIFEAARILSSKLIAGDLIAQPISFLSKTINTLNQRAKSQPSVPAGMSPEKAKRLREINSM